MHTDLGSTCTLCTFEHLYSAYCVYTTSTLCTLCTLHLPQRLEWEYLCNHLSVCDEPKDTFNNHQYSIIFAYLQNTGVIPHNMKAYRILIQGVIFGGPENQKNICPIYAHTDAFSTILVGGQLDHDLACLDDPSPFCGRGKTGTNTDFLKNRHPKICSFTPAQQAPALPRDW